MYLDAWKKINLLHDTQTANWWQVGIKFTLYLADKHQANRILSICLAAWTEGSFLFGN
jgi:hypothetical protein